MTTYRGTDTVNPGLYFDARGLRFTSIDETGPLPGGPDATYRRVPMVAMLALAPVLGLLFVIFLPLIGFGVVAYLLGTKAVAAGATAARETVRVVRPSWQPALAFLSRRKTGVDTPAARPDAQADHRDEWMKDAERTLDEKERHE